MKKYLYMLLAAAVLCSCEEDSKLNPNLLPKDEEEVWVETGELSINKVFQEAAGVPAAVKLYVRIKGYTVALNGYNVIRLVTKSGPTLYMYNEIEQTSVTMLEVGKSWNDDNSISFPVPILCQSGTFDFVVEFPASEQDTTVKLTRSFRTKVWRISMSQTDGVWSVDDLSLVPGQE